MRMKRLIVAILARIVTALYRFAIRCRLGQFDNSGSP
jgi:hypothetical protein